MPHGHNRDNRRHTCSIKRIGPQVKGQVSKIADLTVSICRNSDISNAKLIIRSRIFKFERASSRLLTREFPSDKVNTVHSCKTAADMFCRSKPQAKARLPDGIIIVPIVC
jgi:hypothetical protein